MSDIDSSSPYTTQINDSNDNKNDELITDKTSILNNNNGNNNNSSPPVSLARQQSIENPNWRLFLGIRHPPHALFSLFILVSINLINYIDRYIPSAVKGQIKDDFDLNDFESSLPITIFIIVYMIACPVFGLLADKGWDRRKLICFGVCLWSALTALASISPNYGTFLFVRAMIGIGEASYSMIAPAIISDWYKPKDRSKVLGWYYCAIPVGAALGYGLGGTLGSALGWRWAFVVIGLPGIALGISIMRTVEPIRGATDPKPSRIEEISSVSESQWTVLKILMSNGGFLACCIGQTFSTFGAGGAADWFPYYMQTEFGFSEYGAGLVVGGCTVVGGLLGSILGSYLAEGTKFSIKNSYLAVSGWSSLLSAIFIIFVLTSDSFPDGLIIVLLGGAQIGLWMYIGPITSLISNIVNPKHRTRAFAVATFLQHLFGDSASPSIIGAVSDATSLRAAAAIIPIVWIIAGILWIGSSRFLPDLQKSIREHHTEKQTTNNEEEETASGDSLRFETERTSEAFNENYDASKT